MIFETGYFSLIARRSASGSRGTKLVPLSAAAIDRAIELNEVAVEQNRLAFLWGRRAAVAPGKVDELAAPPRTLPVSRLLSTTLDEVIARRVDQLTEYQDAAYAQRYLLLVDRVRETERRLLGASASKAPGLAFTDAVARGFFKLMAYKDEYEVARLYSQGDFRARLEEQFEGDFKLRIHLAPPLLAQRDAQGRLVKREYGPWILGAMKLLARMRGVRGTWLDVFGRTQERRDERALIDEYEATVSSLLPTLEHETLALATEIAALPQQIRGFGHVKEKSMDAARTRRGQLLERYESGARQAQAA